MTDLEKVRAEIERMKEIINSPDAAGLNDKFIDGVKAAYDEILSFIDSLDSKPNADLEQAAIKFASFPILAGLYDKNTKRGFVAGAQWQIEQIKKEAVEYDVHDVSSNKPDPLIIVRTPGYHTGDKVKCLIFPAYA